MKRYVAIQAGRNIRTLAKTGRLRWHADPMCPALAYAASLKKVSEMDEARFAELELREGDGCQKCLIGKTRGE